MSGSLPPPVALAAPRPTTQPLRARSSWGSREGIALLASLGVGLALWAAAQRGALPAAGPTLAFLLPAVWWDVRELRIPNALTFPALAAVWLWSAVAGGAFGLVGGAFGLAGGAFGLAAGAFGLAGGAFGLAAGAFGLAEALLASGCALALGFGPFAWGWLGAGDVKALMVLAALWGLEAFLPALWWMLVVGGLGALGLLTAQGGLGELLRRWGRSAWITLVRRRPYYEPAAPDSPARQGIPFAVAMGLGCAAYAVFGAPV